MLKKNQLSKLTIIIFLLFLPVFLKAQFNLPPADSIQILLDNYRQDNFDIEKKNFDHTKVFKPWFLVPDLSYDVFNNRFRLAFSLSRFIDFFKLRKENQSRLNTFTLSYEKDTKSIKIKVFNCYYKLINSREQLKLQIDIYKNYKQLFEIKEKQYKKSEINTEEFITAQTNFFEHKKNIFGFIDIINLQINELQNLLSYDFNIFLTYNIIDK